MARATSSDNEAGRTCSGRTRQLPRGVGVSRCHCGPRDRLQCGCVTGNARAASVETGSPCSTCAGRCGARGEVKVLACCGSDSSEPRDHSDRDRRPTVRTRRAHALRYTGKVRQRYEEMSCRLSGLSYTRRRRCASGPGADRDALIAIRISKPINHYTHTVYYHIRVDSNRSKLLRDCMCACVSTSCV